MKSLCFLVQRGNDGGRKKEVGFNAHAIVASGSVSGVS